MRIYMNRIVAVFLLMCLWIFFRSYIISAPESDEEFLARYGWTVTEKVKEKQMTIPISFEHPPGEFPIQIYWAANNELSKAIGFDIKPYLGKEVTAALYNLKETLPEFLPPSENARGVIIRNGENIIGAWIDRGRHYGFACTLDRKSFTDIGVPEIGAHNLSGPEWGEWLVKNGIVNPENEIEKKLSAMTPEQVIETYYTAIDDKNYTLAYACYTRGRLRSYLFSNMGDSQFFNSSLSAAYPDGIENIESIKVVSIRPFKPEDSISGYITIPPGTKVFSVQFNVIYKKELTDYNGRSGILIVLTKEVDALGWRIQEMNTGM